MERLILERGASLRFLPPYSPDLNSLELAFGKLKGHLRERAARTLGALEDALCDSLSLFNPLHCRSFLRHAQYGTH